MKKSWVIIVVLLIIAGIFLWYRRLEAPAVDDTSYKNATYTIDATPVTLVDGVSSIPSVTGSSASVVTKYFGNEVRGDVDGDGRDDVAFLLTQNGGGTGTFYYVVVALWTRNGYKGTNAIFIGDRIAPQTTEIKDGTIIVNYSDRNPNDPMSVPPSVGVSSYLRVQNGTLVTAE